MRTTHRRAHIPEHGVEGSPLWVWGQAQGHTVHTCAPHAVYTLSSHTHSAHAHTCACLHSTTGACRGLRVPSPQWSPQLGSRSEAPPEGSMGLHLQQHPRVGENRAGGLQGAECRCGLPARWGSWAGHAGVAARCNRAGALPHAGSPSSPGSHIYTDSTPHSPLTACLQQDAGLLPVPPAALPGPHSGAVPGHPWLAHVLALQMGS